MQRELKLASSGARYLQTSVREIYWSPGHDPRTQIVTAREREREGIEIFARNCTHIRGDGRGGTNRRHENAVSPGRGREHELALKAQSLPLAVS